VQLLALVPPSQSQLELGLVLLRELSPLEPVRELQALLGSTC
jgi:hypothetical protein